MAIRAVGDRLVLLLVTSAAGLGCVLARKFFELLDLVGVTGQARRGQPVGKSDVQGGVRIGVATGAALEFEVVGALMALAAGGDHGLFLYLGRVSFMAVYAGHLAFMGAATGGDILGRLFMALDAVVGCELRALRISGKNERSGEQNSAEQPGQR